ncbi:hypothetical protein K3495_g2053 [Podosphaera aphanis]|nr:hypothetical protein K3495_g2053 [Podosphaera aphanis]
MHTSTQLSSSSPNHELSQNSEESHTAADILNSQLQLEADAREALPYKFDHCTKLLGKLRQSIFSCLTCNPPPPQSKDPYHAAGICYSCSIQCHGEHNLVELFSKRDFECDCGTTRLPETSPCTLRAHPVTNRKGVHADQPAAGNKYNQNFQNRFCSCTSVYDPETQNSTMFQCLGLGSPESGGCGEDWWHPECVVGLDPNSNAKKSDKNMEEVGGESGRDTQDPIDQDELQDLPPPPGFPPEEDFEGFLCYKCVDAHPWIKRYASSPGFLPPVFRHVPSEANSLVNPSSTETMFPSLINPKKRSLEETKNPTPEVLSKRSKSATFGDQLQHTEPPVLNLPHTNEESKGSETCKLRALRPVPPGQFSLFFKEDFRAYLCHCESCFVLLQAHPQLLEPEETYEPSVSSHHDATLGSTTGSGSLYDRGESALKNIDRVRALEGVMAYNNLKDKLKPFFQQFAESGTPISAEDIKTYFAKIRGDEQAIKEASDAAKADHQKHE